MRNFAVPTMLACAFLFTACPIVFLTSSDALAETAAPAPSPSSETADQALAQRALTETEIQNYIAAQKPIKAAFDKIPEAKRDQPDPQMQAALDKVATQFSFKDYDDYDSVGGNIQFILQGFDSEKKAFVGQEAVLKNEIAGVTADKSMKPKDKTEALGQLKEALKHIEPVKYQDNIALVTKHYAELSAIFDN